MSDPHHMPSRGLLVAGLALTMSIGLSSTSHASTASEERSGARILGSVENGQTACGRLAGGDFDKVGDYAMRRMIGSTAAHERMDALMEQMMGRSATDQMHVALGKRFAGCGRASLPGGFSTMFGVMNMMGGAGADGSRMMGGSYGGRGSMMGGSGAAATSNDDQSGIGTVGWVLVGTLMALLAVAGTVLWRWRPGRRERSPGSAIGGST